MTSTARGLTIRNFREADAAQVYQLFSLGVVGPGSARSVALHQLILHPVSYLSYAIIIVGLALLTKSQEHKALGASLSIGVAALFFGYRSMLSRVFTTYCEESLRGDLADIPGYYKLWPVCPGAEELVPSSPSGFWVVERERQDKSGLEIIGCVALDCQMKDGTLQGELRRMVVSPNHRRMGIGALLIENLIAHASKHHVPSVVLATTQFQTNAMQLYQKFGWMKQYKTMTRGHIGVWLFHYQLDLTGIQDASL